VVNVVVSVIASGAGVWEVVATMGCVRDDLD